MERFIGRTSELRALNEMYASDRFEMTVIYGRRRIGKSYLIREFIKSKKAVYFTAVKNGLVKNVELWGRIILQELAPEMSGLVFTSVESILDFIGSRAKEEPLVIVIDELPYFAEADPTFLSVLQNYIDHSFKDTKMKLILCGSSVSFMEDAVLSEKSPLFGRRTSQINLKPFDYLESALFTPDYTVEEKAICYGITGGVASYLSMLDDSRSLDENIIRLYFRKEGYLYEEPMNLITQEYRNVSVYNAIIGEMAKGTNRLTDISNKTHIDVTSISHALPNLMVTGIVRKDTAITDENNKKKVQYRISDPMFLFWNRFVADAQTFIELDRGEMYYHKYVKPLLHEYMGEVFEDMCRYYSLLMGMEGVIQETFAVNIVETGKWWGTNPRNKEATDIDVVALDKKSSKALIGECKFKNEQIDKDVFDSLVERTGLIDHKYTHAGYLLFSLNGFSEWMKERAKDGNVLLVTLEDMYHN